MDGMRIKPTRTAVALVIVFLSVTVQPQRAPDAQRHPPAEARVDVNQASLEELLKVPGMTRSWAARIVRYRPYHGKNELLDLGVVSSEVYDRIKDHVVAHRQKP
jgi:DNA uptake protein ComE-like DNA-binding protein